MGFIRSLKCRNCLSVAVLSTTGNCFSFTFTFCGGVFVGSAFLLLLAAAIHVVTYLCYHKVITQGDRTQLYLSLLLRSLVLSARFDF